jgi:hypothetical protein
MLASPALPHTTPNVISHHSVLIAGYLISCVSTSMSMALAIGPPLIVPFLLFGGFFLNNR